MALYRQYHTKCLLLRNPWPGFFLFIKHLCHCLQTSILFERFRLCLSPVVLSGPFYRSILRFGLSTHRLSVISLLLCCGLVRDRLLGVRFQASFSVCILPRWVFTLSSATSPVGRVIFCYGVWICRLVHPLDALSLPSPPVVCVIPCCISRSGLLRFYVLPPSILRSLRFALRSHLWMPFLTNEKAFCLSCSFSSWCLDLLCGLPSSILRSLGVDRLSCRVVLVPVVCSILQVSFPLAFLASG